MDKNFDFSSDVNIFEGFGLQISFHDGNLKVESEYGPINYSLDTNKWILVKVWKKIDETTMEIDDVLVEDSKKI